MGGAIFMGDNIDVDGESSAFGPGMANTRQIFRVPAPTRKAPQRAGARFSCSLVSFPRCASRRARGRVRHAAATYGFYRWTLVRVRGAEGLSHREVRVRTPSRVAHAVGVRWLSFLFQALVRPVAHHSPRSGSVGGVSWSSRLRGPKFCLHRAVSA